MVNQKRAAGGARETPSIPTTCTESEKENALNDVITLYPYINVRGEWVFDDPDFDLVEEAFVAGADTLIDYLTADIEDAPSGFRLDGSRYPFSDAMRVVMVAPPDETRWTRYALLEPRIELALCPSLFHYFEEAPAELWVRASAINAGTSDEVGQG